MPNEDLHQPLKAINKTIARLREDVQSLTGEVRKIVTVVEEAAETIRDAIQESIQAQAELKLMEHVMEVRAVKPQIEAEHEQMEAEHDELDERLRSIDERYQRRHEDLDEAARERIRDLGSHIFEIDEEQFEAGIEEPFTEQVTPAFRFLQAHNEDVGEERTERVRGTTSDVVQTIHDFVDRQAALVETIQDHRLDPDEVALPADRTEHLQIPYYVVEYEADGVAQREVVVPSRLSTDDGTDWCSVSLSPVRGVEELLTGVSDVEDVDTTATLPEGMLVRTLDEYGESSLLGVSYGDAVADALPDRGSVPVRVAGGDD